MQGDFVMKKLLTIAFVLGSMVFTVPFAQAKDNSANSNGVETLQQRRGSVYHRQNRRNNRRYDRNSRSRVRTYYQTRNVRRGRYYYRETYRVRVLPNGRRQVKLVSRSRINTRYRRNY
jgi:hypothetical protein